MVTFGEATLLVRKTFQQQYVLYGFEYDDEYVYEILSKDYKKMYTNQSMLVSVNKNDGDVYVFDLGKAIDDANNYAKAREKRIIIDDVKGDS